MPTEYGRQVVPTAIWALLRYLFCLGTAAFASDQLLEDALHPTHPLQHNVRPSGSLAHYQGYMDRD